jgi:hypothetical protein
MRKTILVLLALTAAAYGQGPSPETLKMMRPQAGFAMGLQVRRLMQSPLGDMVDKQLKSQAMPGVGAMPEMFRKVLNEVDSVLLMADTKEIVNQRAAAGKQRAPEPPVLVIVEGRFTQVRDLMRNGKQTPELYRNVELYRVDAKRNDTRMALVGNAMLFGQRSEVTAAIDRLNRPALQPAVASRLTQMNSSYDFWMILDTPEAALQDAPGGVSQMFAKVKGVDMGMGFQTGMNMEVNLRTRTADAVKPLADAVRGIMAMAAMNAGNDPGAAEAMEMLKKLQVSEGASQVQITLSLTREEVERATVKFQEQAKARSASAAASSPVREERKITNPAPPGKIRITGLGDSPVEVPLQTEKK